MESIENLIDNLSKMSVDDPFVNRIERVRSIANIDNQKFAFLNQLAKPDSTNDFSEAWDTFEDSTTWDNSWDQGVR